MEPKQQDVLESFRDSLKDLVAVATKLEPHCPNVEDLISVAKLALESDAQLKLLASLVTSGSGKR